MNVAAEWVLGEAFADDTIAGERRERASRSGIFQRLLVRHSHVHICRRMKAAQQWNQLLVEPPSISTAAAAAAYATLHLQFTIYGVNNQDRSCCCWTGVRSLDVLAPFIHLIGEAIVTLMCVIQTSSFWFLNTKKWWL